MPESRRFHEALEQLLWFRAHDRIHLLLSLGEELLEAVEAEPVQQHVPARIWEFVELPPAVKIVE